jgi:hypothetical protein
MLSGAGNKAGEAVNARAHQIRATAQTCLRRVQHFTAEAKETFQISLFLLPKFYTFFSNAQEFSAAFFEMLVRWQNGTPTRRSIYMVDDSTERRRR